jgi:sec-independent protein translocase protein TatA
MILQDDLLAILPSLGWPELVVVGILALLVFGRRLPEVGRSLGKGIVEFKKGLADTGDEIKGVARDAGKKSDGPADGAKSPDSTASKPEPHG